LICSVLIRRRGRRNARLQLLSPEGLSLAGVHPALQRIKRLLLEQVLVLPETAEDNPYLPVPPAAAMADIASLTASTGPVLIHLLDNSVSPALMNALAKDPPGVPWYGFARFGQDLRTLIVAGTQAV